MNDTISKLLQAYENGKMSRRTLIQGLAMLAAGSTAAEAAGFQGNSINHISLQVSNLQRSTDFYQRVFDCKVNKREGNNQLVFGKNFLSTARREAGGQSRSFCNRSRQLQQGIGDRRSQ